MNVRLAKGKSWMVVLAGLAAVAMSACAGQNPILSTGPSPRVEDCALIQQATPARFVCGGKVYTAVQLTDIRDGKTAEKQ